MSLGSPFGAPASTHFTMVSICPSVSERSFLYFWIPTDLSRCQGGIWRVETRLLMERAQGRLSSYVTSDIGAIDSGRWHASHFSWKMGAMSFVNVGADLAAAVWALAASGSASTAPIATANNFATINVLLWKDEHQERETKREKR